MRTKQIVVLLFMAIASAALALNTNTPTVRPISGVSTNPPTVSDLVNRPNDSYYQFVDTNGNVLSVVNPITTNGPVGMSNTVRQIAAPDIASAAATAAANLTSASNSLRATAISVANTTFSSSNMFAPESFYLAAGALPPLGWHSWNTQDRTNLWASNIVAAVDGLYTNKLVNYGWNWVEVDDNVFTSTNAQGLLIPDAVHWANHPTNVIKYAQDRKIKVMWYNELGKFTDGMSVATNGDGSYFWPSFGTQNKHVENGNMLASWGVDGVWTHGDWTSESTAIQSYQRMIEYYRAISTNRPVYFLSINSKPHAWDAGGDILRPENSQNWSCWYPGSGICQDMASDLLQVMERMIDLASQPYVSKTIRPGHHVTFGVYPLLPSWIRMGFGGAALFASPLMITTWPTQFKDLPLTSQQVLTNTDFLAIHQDPAVIPGFKVLDMPTTSYDWIKNGDIPTNPLATNILSVVTNSVWLRPLAQQGSYAVFLLNRGSNSASIYFNRTNLPIAQVNYNMRDVWAQTNMVDLTNQTVSISVPSNSISIYKLSLPVSAASAASLTPPLVISRGTGSTGGDGMIFSVTNSADGAGIQFGTIGSGYSGFSLGTKTTLGFPEFTMWGTNNVVVLNVPDSSGYFDVRFGNKRMLTIEANGTAYLGSINTTNTVTSRTLTLTGYTTGPTNSTAPGNTTTIRAWVDYTNASGGVFKLPLYQ